MNIFITGIAGFIGFSLAKFLIKKNYKIYGVDNFDNYYNVKLKKDRIKILKNIGVNFKKIDINNNKKLKKYLLNKKIDIVYHLAAQAGVRYSLKNPKKYVYSNILGFLNVIEAIKNQSVKKVIYASSSSVYGFRNNLKKFNENENINKPMSFYAATKISNEIMASYFSRIYNLRFIGIRFFTNYGPYGRPDMAIHKIVTSILEKKTVHLVNKGKVLRDFIFIDDSINFLANLLKFNFNKTKGNYNNEIFNCGSGSKISILKLTKIIIKKLKIRTRIVFTKKETTDMEFTYADTRKMKKIINVNTKLDKGLDLFISWYKSYYKC
jgi:UDP-glucuronate 4-epimerase